MSLNVHSRFTCDGLALEIIQTSAKDAHGRVTSAKDARGRVTSAKDTHECVSPGAEGSLRRLARPGGAWDGEEALSCQGR